MIELLTQNITSILGVLGVSGITGLLAWKTTRDKGMQDIYQEMIQDLREDRELSKKEIKETREGMEELRKKINSVSLELASIRRYKCTVMNCQNRKEE